MGYFGPLFFSEKIAQLKAFRATLTDEKQIAEVDAEIAELEAKQAEKQGE
jgi:hypothetical protein